MPQLLSGGLFKLQGSRNNVVIKSRQIIWGAEVFIAFSSGNAFTVEEYNEH